MRLTAEQLEDRLLCYRLAPWLWDHRVLTYGVYDDMDTWQPYFDVWSQQATVLFVSSNEPVDHDPHSSIGPDIHVHIEPPDGHSVNFPWGGKYYSDFPWTHVHSNIYTRESNLDSFKTHNAIAGVLGIMGNAVGPWTNSVAGIYAKSSEPTADDFAAARELFGSWDDVSDVQSLVGEIRALPEPLKQAAVDQFMGHLCHCGELHEEHGHENQNHVH